MPYPRATLTPSPTLFLFSSSPAAPPLAQLLLARSSSSPADPPLPQLLLAHSSSSPADPPLPQLLLARSSSSPAAPRSLLLCGALITYISIASSRSQVVLHLPVLPCDALLFSHSVFPILMWHLTGREDGWEGSATDSRVLYNALDHPTDPFVVPEGTTTKMIPRQKYYVVFEGRSRGIYNSWEQCQPLVYRYKGALFRSFHTYEAAEYQMNEYLHNKYGRNVVVQFTFLIKSSKSINYIKHS
ncbi:hypothetical protein EJ110_NYTH40785 [Nymphaea thermarum]|nr:hypothetical protein EJ110_NYTH40785 [Nymphaea thermarum]